MKVWLAQWNTGPHVLFYKEPYWSSRRPVPSWISDSRNNHIGFCVCVSALREMGFPNIPKGNELNEYDLSGPKPRYVCTWVPA